VTLSGIDGNNTLWSQHKGLIRQAIANKAKGLFTDGIKPLL
jgi:hypothetical protein